MRARNEEHRLLIKFITSKTLAFREKAKERVVNRGNARREKKDVQLFNWKQ